MSKLKQLSGQGQVMFLDYFRRGLIASGSLQRLIDRGLGGVILDPRVLARVIAGSSDYHEEPGRPAVSGESAGTTAAKPAAAGKSSGKSAAEPGVADDLAGKSTTRTEAEIYEALILEDAARAAELFLPLYRATGGEAGYVCLGLDPAGDPSVMPEAMAAQARRLVEQINQPNLMVGIPATAAGTRAMEDLTAQGIGVLATHIFSLTQYEPVAEAYLAGLERRVAAGGDLERITSLASVAISPLDRAVDEAATRSREQAREEERPSTGVEGTLEETPKRAEPSLTVALANARLAYARFKELFSGPRWQSLAEQGARVQRLLWSGTRHPRDPDTLYVDNLIGRDTVSALPPDTLNAFLDHGRVEATLEQGLEEARNLLRLLDRSGIDLEALARQLQQDELAAAAESLEAVRGAIRRKRQSPPAPPLELRLGPFQEALDRTLARLEEARILERLWAHDHTIWKPEPREIANRLGWLHIPQAMNERIPRLRAFSRGLRAEGFTQALLLGMGGSSLAPEVYSRVFGSGPEGLGLSVLDSTDPGAVLARARGMDPTRTLFIVSTKSGGTVETLSLFKFFYNRLQETPGVKRPGEHFIAITDPGSKLAELAEQHGFRATFLNDPRIGGRYSALSYFGLVPAALIGLDLELLLERALAMAANGEPWNSLPDNRGARLGATMAELALAGRDKLTFIISEPLAPFGDWVEQLIAESTGKEGKGILPVVGEPSGEPSAYGPDRLFVYLRLAGQETGEEAAEEPAEEARNRALDGKVAALEAAGRPVIRLNLADRYDLGAQLFLWELATAVAGHRLGINPFDQPDVESAKVGAREMVAGYQEDGRLADDEPSPPEPAALKAFLGQARPGDYLALQAYLNPTPETTAALQALRVGLGDKFHLATTLGYGPRFLHSTGQLHKGDRGGGLFLQLTADDVQDAPIPDRAGAAASSISFGILKLAQALGDNKALKDKGRRVIRFHLGKDISAGLKRLAGALS